MARKFNFGKLLSKLAQTKEADGAAHLSKPAALAEQDGPGKLSIASPELSAGKSLAKAEALFSKLLGGEGKACSLIPDSSTAMSLALGGSASAVGQQTLAEGSIESSLLDKGNVSIARGTTTFTAAAQSSSAAYSSAETFATASGADLILTCTRTKNVESIVDGKSVTTAVSTTKILAIDFAFFDFANGPLVLNKTQNLSVSQPAKVCAGDVGLDGNVAAFKANATAEGPGTAVNVDFSALALANQYSEVTGSAVSEIA